MRSGSDVLQPLRSAGPFVLVVPMASIDIKVFQTFFSLILAILFILAILLQTGAIKGLTDLFSVLRRRCL